MRLISNVSPWSIPTPTSAPRRNRAALPSSTSVLPCSASACRTSPSSVNGRTDCSYAKPALMPSLAWMSNWTRCTWILTLLKKVFSAVSASSLLSTRSTQSSPALARSASGTRRSLLARTASSSSFRTYSCPTGSIRLASSLSTMGTLMAWTTYSWSRVPAGHRPRAPFSPGLGGALPWWSGLREGAGP